MTRLTQASTIRKTRPSSLHSHTRAQNMASKSSEEIRQSSPKLSSIRRSEVGRKRSAADAELFEVPGAKNIRIQENLDEDSSCTEEDVVGSDSDLLEVKKPLYAGPKSRGFSNLPSELQPIAQRAQRYVSEYTLFTNPFLTSVDVIHLLVESWNAGQDAEQSYHERTKDCDTLLKGVHSRERSNLVFHCRQRILSLYKLDNYDKEEKAKRVAWLLDQDRFVCREDQRETFGCRFRAREIVDVIFQLYFERPKMRGNRDPEFFNMINNSFIWLISSAIQHCLREWKTGEAVQELVDFKYETAQRGYQRLQNTWQQYDKSVQRLLLANIKAELSNLISGKQKKTQPESVEPCKINEAADYAEQLKKELTTSVEEQRFPGIRTPNTESPLSDVLEPITRSSQVSPKHDEGLTSIDSDDEDADQETLGAYSFDSQIVR